MCAEHSENCPVALHFRSDRCKVMGVFRFHTVTKFLRVRGRGLLARGGNVAGQRIRQSSPNHSPEWRGWCCGLIVDFIVVGIIKPQ